MFPVIEVDLQNIGLYVFCISDNILVTKGIRQRDSVSPALFNVSMDETINEVKQMEGYRMGRSVFSTVCYADEVVLIGEHKNDLHLRNIT